ncbi:glycoside hydrolase family 57 protein [Nevskia soli]|uniref:glycoside hydrolase family 57 protein n=1 Tax=Nevskia soli TaxID=418856 RepID=UPI0004A71BB9|nr:glycoside hydrolase family 57 protein [Nevskia soli]
MPADPRAPVAILWHMHQPEYRVEGIPALPWAYLHGLRAYTDMASHLEAVPEARAVVNFSPVLLDQLLELAQQAQAALAHGTPPSEPLMAALLAPPPRAMRVHLLEICLHGHQRNAKYRYEEYYRLAVEVSAALDAGEAAVSSLPEQSITDMVIWYHLIWLGESVRRTDSRAIALMVHRRNFSTEHRVSLLTLVADLLSGIVPRYRALGDSGQVELSMSPYFHPILPLLVDFESAREAAPGVPLPASSYPGGRDRALWHLRKGQELFWEVFGIRPRGCWPSEAAVSQDTAALLQSAGFTWFASSQSVQRASTPKAADRDATDSCVCRLQGIPLVGFFRDDGLSDNIGFTYKDWEPQHAVADLVDHLDSLSKRRNGQVVVLALDGENPWEYYADNGIDFVRGLYLALTTHPRLRMTTFANHLDENPAALPELPSLSAGSWVYGQLLTWIGSSSKNHAWDLLIEAKRCFDASTHPSPSAQRAMGVCEGSDWFWWPGMPHPGAAVAEFDHLFRAHLKALYRALGTEPPEALNHPLQFAASNAEASPLGAMLPSC